MVNTVPVDPRVSKGPGGGSTSRHFGGELRWSDARWYSPTDLRWLEEDPSGLAPDSNPYRYCENDPTDETDPTGLEGHHWVPQAVVRDNARFLEGGASGAAATVFGQETRGALAYAHGNDTWLGVTHRQYNNAVEELLQNYAGSLPDGKLDGAQAQKFVGWISGSSTEGLQEFLPGNEEIFKTVVKWRKGFEQSAVVAEAAAEEAAKQGVKLSETNLKAIAKYAVNGEMTEGLTASAKLVYNGIRGSKAVLGAVAKKVIPGLIFLQFAAAAKNGYSNGVPTGQTGVPGAIMATMREGVAADLVEGIAFPAIGKVMDAIENELAPGGMDAARARIAQRNLHGVTLPPAPAPPPPAAFDVYDGSEIDQFGNIRRYYHDDTFDWYEDDKTNIGAFDVDSAAFNFLDDDDDY